MKKDAFIAIAEKEKSATFHHRNAADFFKSLSMITTKAPPDRLGACGEPSRTDGASYYLVA